MLNVCLLTETLHDKSDIIFDLDNPNVKVQQEENDKLTAMIAKDRDHIKDLHSTFAKIARENEISTPP